MGLMERLEAFSYRFFPSDPRQGKIGSIRFNLWLAQVAGVPVLGLKPESLNVKLLLLLYGVPMTVAITFVYTGFEFYDLYLNWRDLDMLTQNICLSFTHFAGVVKTLNMFYSLGDIRKIVQKLENLTRTCVITKEQSQVFYRGEMENKMYLLIYGSLVSATGCLGMCMLFYSPASVAGQIFPYRVVLPSWMPAQVQLLYMGVSVLLFALQIVAIDYLNINMMNQIRFHFKILNLTFDELVHEETAKSARQNDDDVDGEDKAVQGVGQKMEKFQTEKGRVPGTDKWAEEQRRNLEKRPPFKEPVEPSRLLQKVVDHHCALIELRSDVESVFRTPILLQFFTSLVIFAMTGFQATVRAGGSNGAVLIYFYCGCIFCELFFYCWFGNAVFEQAKTLATSGYSSSWYMLDKRFRRSLIIFIINSQNTYLFTAGGFMGLSLPSFANILSKSYSFIAVLRQIYK